MDFVSYLMKESVCVCVCVCMGGGSLISVKVCLLLYRNAYNPQLCSVFTIELVKSYTNGEIWPNLARFYDWYKVCLSLKVKVTYQTTPPTYLCMGLQIWKRFYNAQVENYIEINTDEFFPSHPSRNW